MLVLLLLIGFAVVIQQGVSNLTARAQSFRVRTRMSMLVLLLLVLLQFQDAVFMVHSFRVRPCLGHNFHQIIYGPVLLTGIGSVFGRAFGQVAVAADAALARQ